MAEYCIHCGHGWSEHHSLASVSHDADGKPLPPFGTVRECDLCGCARYYGREMVPQKWLVIWSSATGSGNDTVNYPDHLTRAQVIARYESAHHGCYVDQLINRGGPHNEGDTINADAARTEGGAL